MALKKKGKAKKQARVELSDWEFVERLLAVNENRAELSRGMGITRGAVSQRAKRLAAEIEEVKQSGAGAKVAAIVERVIPTQQEQQAAQVKASAFTRELEAVGRQYHIFDHLEELHAIINALLGDVLQEINKTKAKGKPVNPYHIDQVIKLVGQSRALTTDAHKIKIDLSNARHGEEFIRAVTTIILQYDPEVRKKLYVELSQVGVEGQTAFLLA